nr:reverse transcriptase domain-containing protein [Tanacetum cinerariifolium]
DFVIVDYESDPRVRLILGRPLLWTARALIDVYGEEMILHDDDERLTLNTRLDNPNVNLVDTIPEMFTDKHTLDYSSPPLYDDFDDDLFELESDNADVYNDPFDSKEDKIKESKLLIDELDLPRSSNFLPSPEYDSFLFEDFFEVDALPSTNNEDKVFNPSILIHENLSEVIIQVTPDKNVKKLSNATLILKDFNPPLYELPFHKEVPGFETLLSFSSENEEKVFKPEILTYEGVHTSLLPKLSHRDLKAFKEFADELALITFLLGNDDLSFDIESDLREIEYFLNHDPTKEMDSILKDLVDEDNLADPNVNLVDTIPEMFTDKHSLDYSSPPLYDDFDDDLFELESDNADVYNDPFDSKEDKIKESKLLIDELDLPRS